ncbi:hypothetical protein PPERSA_03511 [Pseudocohnilembus persalinus]|uniref:Uncharacterized protein n=1 Tax=Pseudocohnilembus persalinus TaxID=266149 RepID=A0A0V0R2Y2_PSEPJ|nr:hypothetical protein PPERSA_03511 [Pseudocohnilembus persalinus]|eukprot:KRX08640.1 hypothetical protein PPERSA_03511 [Pseudocohnilembus persalinus]
MSFHGQQSLTNFQQNNNLNVFKNEQHNDSINFNENEIFQNENKFQYSQFNPIKEQMDEFTDILSPKLKSNDSILNSERIKQEQCNQTSIKIPYMNSKYAASSNINNENKEKTPTYEIVQDRSVYTQEQQYVKLNKYICGLRKFQR